MLTNQSGPSGQICLTFSNAKVSVNLAILHPLTINCHPVSCIYDGIRQILTFIIHILGNICKRVANFRTGFYCLQTNYLRRVRMSSDLKQVCYHERLRYRALAKKILLKKGPICTSRGELS